MLTWPDVQKLARERFPVARSSAAALLLALDIGGQRQKVLLDSTTVRGRPAVGVTAEIASGRLFPAEKALEYNATAELGALALARGMLVLRQLLLLETSAAEDLDAAVRAAAVEAARIRHLVSRPELHSEVSRVTFAYLAE